MEGVSPPSTEESEATGVARAEDASCLARRFRRGDAAEVVAHQVTLRLKLAVNLLRFLFRQIDHAAGDVSVTVGIEAAHLRSEDVPAHIRSISFTAKISQVFFIVVTGIGSV